ncbi:acetyl-CoA carboxylase biotin carboxylase subunit family protein [Vibrio gazogenes]|uniref:ATP-grasp domain-containing protein n=1 Tax=Vibrio gazogenes DSM 21264 = NBRC 103151 TaxID=1123492 RepID=A0A1M4YVY6_VIBGA|nr:ATP-grasp domain-containing protein [Vibrio gazogenes]USP15105.1 ATP-grasp domain-containing protein [Vibrio gazogenes]SHF09506.1 ATP-grasp domain-containing protein [Vibrio gazogenes DSM 21264] [Vibrio gazogenes DSM 21264 = NBRC 103151]SJN56397.1 argininosuccinate lyase [Vibrio gazogenes]
MNLILIEALTFGLGRLTEAAKDLGIHLYLLTYNRSIYEYELSKIESEHLTVVDIDTFNIDSIVDYAKSLDDLKGVVNLTDTWTHVSVQVNERLGLVGQNPESVLIARNKDLLRKTLIDNNLTTGQYMLLEVDSIDKSTLTSIRYPVIVKDPSGTGSKNVWLATDKQNLLMLLTDIKDNPDSPEKLLLETYFTGTLYSAETLSYAGETRLISISSRILSDVPLFMEKAISLPVETEGTELASVEGWIKKVLNSISYTDGFAHTEFVVTSDGLEVIEINPRLGGVQIGESLCKAFNSNIYSAYIEMGIGQKPALLNEELTKHTSVGQVCLYAKETGKFKRIDDTLVNDEKCRVYPCAKRGKEILKLNDQSACVAILTSEGETSEIALLNAIAESNRVIVEME